MTITAGRLGLVLAGIWLLLMGCVQFGLALPAALLAVLAIIAGICLIIAALAS